MARDTTCDRTALCTRVTSSFLQGIIIINYHFRRPSDGEPVAGGIVRSIAEGVAISFSIGI